MVPEPLCVRVPVPEMLPATVRLLLELKTSLELLETLPGSEPSAAPSPMVKVPEEMVVPPLQLLLVAVRTGFPVPAMITDPPPEIAPAMVPVAP